MIEKIYAFGTSHTAGGGFEFNVSDRYRNNPNLYKKIFDTEDHFDFSYPNILGRMINVEVVNFSQSEVFDVSKLNGSSNSKNLKCTTKLNYHLPKFAPLSYFVPVAVVPLLKKFYSIYKMLKLG